jgi:alanine racemase
MDRWIEIDLAAIRQNIKLLKQHSKSKELMAVVKADAYGHGLVEVAKTARSAGADWLGCALIEEAIALRESGDSGQILAWLGNDPIEFENAVNKNIDIAISSNAQLEITIAAAKKLNKLANVHIKVDTGLNRNGVTLNEFDELLQLVLSKKSLNLVGLMSHFAFPDDAKSEVNAKQIARFSELVKKVPNLKIAHLANSMATMQLPQAHFDLVRPGLAIYGLAPSGEIALAQNFGLRPAISLKAKIANLKSVAKDEGLSYNHTYKTKKATKIAVIPLGYSDGIDRRASNSAPIEIAGKTYQISGRVCMDQFVVDVGQEFDQPQAVATLFGDSQKGFPSVEDWAKATSTINYEIIARLASRIKRVYLNP